MIKCEVLHSQHTCNAGDKHGGWLQFYYLWLVYFGVELIDLRANTAHSNRVSRIYSAAAAAKLLHQPLVSHILSKHLGEESTCLTSLPAVASGSAWPLDYVFLLRTCLCLSVCLTFIHIAAREVLSQGRHTLLECVWHISVMTTGFGLCADAAGPHTSAINTRDWCIGLENAA